MNDVICVALMNCKKEKDAAPLMKISVKHFSSPTTHSYAASSARDVLLMVSVRTFPLVSMMYLKKGKIDYKYSFIKQVICF